MSCQREEKQRVAEKVKYKASNLRKKAKVKRGKEIVRKEL